MGASWAWWDTLRRVWVDMRHIGWVYDEWRWIEKTSRLNWDNLHLDCDRFEASSRNWWQIWSIGVMAGRRRVDWFTGITLNWRHIEWRWTIWRRLKGVIGMSEAKWADYYEFDAFAANWGKFRDISWGIHGICDEGGRSKDIWDELRRHYIWIALTSEQLKGDGGDLHNTYNKTRQLKES